MHPTPLQRASHERCAGEAQLRADCARNYLVQARGVDAGSLVAADGGFREMVRVELYLSPKDVYPPLLTPTVSPGKVEILPGRLQSSE